MLLLFLSLCYHCTRRGQMSSASCFCTVLLPPLPLTAKGLARGQGYLQLILSYFGQMTNASIRLAFTSLSSEDWVPSYIQGIFDEQLLGSGAGLSNYCHELWRTVLLPGHLCLPPFAFFFFFFLSCSQISFQVRSLTRLQTLDSALPEGLLQEDGHYKRWIGTALLGSTKPA